VAPDLTHASRVGVEIASMDKPSSGWPGRRTERALTPERCDRCTSRHDPRRRRRGADGGV